MRDANEPATIHADTSDWLIDARTSHRPDAAGAPIDMYATPRGTPSPNANAPGPNADVVRKFTSPENGVAVKNDAAMFAALSKARPKSDPAGASGPVPRPPSLAASA